MADPDAAVRRYFEVVADLDFGTELVAHIAAWLTVADGQVREHETFDCYDPF